MKEDLKNDLMEFGQTTLIAVVLTVIVLAHHGKIGGGNTSQMPKEKTETAAADSLQVARPDSVRTHIFKMSKSHTR